MSIPEEFSFLQEKPLESIEELSNSKFGHEEIATTLQQIIKKSPSPFTIGLFGKWGSGKSTVANSLKKRLPKDNIPVIIFDVWKHEGDALRRTFLKEMVQQLKNFGENFFDIDFKINERVEQSISRSSESKIKFNKDAFEQLAPFLVGFLFFVIVGGCIASYYNKIDLFLQIIAICIGSSSGGAILLWAVKNSVDLFSKETVNYGVDKFEDPHEFEEEFSSILCNLKHPRILIVFDNLDRVTEDKVSAILSTIKTFLEPKENVENKKEVIFLIPCDARAIKEHLSSIYNASANSVFNPDEFLRKFFNTIIWIPDFIPSELELFAQTSLRKTKVKLLDNNNVAWIIIKVFRDNPRQIIQFVNILLANYLLVAEREGDQKDFSDGFLKDNVPQLTKYLVLNQLFPEEMEALREKKISNLQDVKREDLVNKDGKEIDTRQDFLDFVEETRNIPIDNLRIFFTLRRSAQEKEFPGFDSFIAYLEDRKTEEAKKYCSQIGDFSNSDIVDSFSQSIKSELASKTNPVSIVNLIHTLFEVISDGKISLSATVYTEINNLFKGKAKDQISTISPQLIDTVFLSKYPLYRKKIVTEWVRFIKESFAQNRSNERPLVEDIFKVFVAHPDYVDTNHASDLQQVLVSHLITDTGIIKIITENKDLQEKIIPAPYLEQFVSALPAGGNSSDISNRVDILNNIDDSVLNQLTPDNLLQKFAQLQTTENQTPTNSIEDKTKTLLSYEKIINQHFVWINSAQDLIKNAFVDSLLAGFRSLPAQDSRIIFIPILLQGKNYATEAKKQEIDVVVNEFINGASPSVVSSMITSLPESLKEIFFSVDSYYSSGQNRAFHDQSFRKEWFVNLPDNQKQSFLPRFFNQNHSDGIAFVNDLDSSNNEVVNNYIQLLGSEIKDGSNEFPPFVDLIKGLNSERFSESVIQDLLLEIYKKTISPLKQEIFIFIVEHKNNFSGKNWKNFEEATFNTIETGPIAEVVSTLSHIPTKINTQNFDTDNLVDAICSRIKTVNNTEFEQLINITLHPAIEAELGKKKIDQIIKASIDIIKSSDDAKRNYVKSKLTDFIQRAEDKIGVLKKIISIIVEGPIAESTQILNTVQGMTDFWAASAGSKKEFAKELKIEANKLKEKEIKELMIKSSNELAPPEVKKNAKS